MEWVDSLVGVGVLAASGKGGTPEAVGARGRASEPPDSTPERRNTELLLAQPARRPSEPERPDRLSPSSGAGSGGKVGEAGGGEVWEARRLRNSAGSEASLLGLAGRMVELDVTVGREGASAVAGVTALLPSAPPPDERDPRRAPVSTEPSPPFAKRPVLPDLTGEGGSGGEDMSPGESRRGVVARLIPGARSFASVLAGRLCSSK